MLRRFALTLTALAAATALAACGSSNDANTESSVSGFTPREAGVLTVGTELPDPPFVIAESIDEIGSTAKDAVGPGYEVEMVNEIAKRLGDLKVKWVNFPFNGLVAGTPCPCDFDVNGVSIFPDRKEKVDFSAPYFTANQGVVVKEGTSVADRAAATELQFGAAKDSSGLFYLENELKPTKTPRVYPSTVALKLAVSAGDIDAAMTDVPIALDFQAKSDGKLVVAGQFATTEQYGAVLAKDSPNTAAVSAVISQLSSEGFFDQLRAKYFPDQVKIPNLG